MSPWKRGRQYWTDFTINGRRYRKRLGTTNLRVATRRERELIEEAGHGRLPVDEQGPKRLSEAIDAYLAAKRIRCSARTIELEEERLSIVKKHFGDVPLSAITVKAIAEFQRTRHDPESRSDRRSTPSMLPGARQRIMAMAMGTAQTRGRSRRSWRSATTPRHSHVTVCFCVDPRLPVNC
jgi:hypothetical protein